MTAELVYESLKTCIRHPASADSSGSSHVLVIWQQSLCFEDLSDFIGKYRFAWIILYRGACKESVSLIVVSFTTLKLDNAHNVLHASKFIRGEARQKTCFLFAF